MLYIIYNFILFATAILLSPLIVYKIIKGKYRKSLIQRLGFVNEEKFTVLENKKVIWVHAVSVGETAAAEPVVKEIKKKFPEYKILFSTITETGQEMARKIIDADSIIYFPLDFSIILKKYFRRIKPEAVVIMETELWPNFIRFASESDSRVFLANGRISDSSFSKYKYLGPFLRDMLNNIDRFSMQSEQDKQYILKLGAEEKKVVNNGNTKFDRDFVPDEKKEEREIRAEFGLFEDQPVFISGSTHPDEEKQLIPVFRDLKREFPELVMIIAPRHIRRTEEIEEIYQKEGIETVRRTEIATRDDESVILVNTIGELSGLYIIADLVFVGGSLVEKGGHNILEPAAQGKPVFFGPHMFNFKDNVRLIKEYDAGVQVKDREELRVQLLDYLQNPDKRVEKAENARRMITDNKGAAGKNVRILEDILN